MITATLEQQDIKLTYQLLCFWINDGITADAVDVCRHKWNALPGNKYSTSQIVRNKDFSSKPIQPVIKW